MGNGFPIVSIWQLDLDPSHRMMAAGTHGRGVFTMTDTEMSPALVVSKVDAGIPVGPASTIDYTITLKNIGNANATGVKVTDPISRSTRASGPSRMAEPSRAGSSDGPALISRPVPALTSTSV